MIVRVKLFPETEMRRWEMRKNYLLAVKREMNFSQWDARAYRALAPLPDQKP